MAEQEKSYFETPGEYIIDGVRFTKFFKPEVIHKIKDNFTFKDDDTLLATYSKSGTTWIQTILYLLNNPTDLHNRNFSVNPQDTIPFMEKGDNMEKLNNMMSPRLLKSHLPFPFLKKALSSNKTKVIVVMRNPKDTLVSFYHFYRVHADLGNFQGTWSEFFEMFLNDRIVLDNWFNYTLTWWEQRKRGNIIYIKFEDMKENLEREIGKVAAFIGKEISQDDVRAIAELTSFGQMKKLIDPHFQHVKLSEFMRKGQIGDWKNHFTVAQNELFDQLYEDKMKDTGLDFRFEV